MSEYITSLASGPKEMEGINRRFCCDGSATWHMRLKNLISIEQINFDFWI